MLKLKMFEMFNDLFIGVNPITGTMDNAKTDTFDIVIGLAGIAGMICAAYFFINANGAKRFAIGILIGVVMAILVYNGQLMDMLKGWAGA